MLNLFQPRERLTPSEWAIKRRYLSAEASAKGGGRFTFDLCPWQREALDEQYNPDVGRIVLMWASQTTGKTETINNMVGHSIEIDPCPILDVQPTLEMAETWSKDRLAPMLRDTPSLRGKVRDVRSRESNNTILHKRFPGGAITISGANSAASLASRPIRKVFLDEVDRYPASAGTEGDPIALAEKRTESFPDAMIVETSTPTIKGISRVEKTFDQSDKRKWFVTFPCCGHETTLEWGMIKWENHDSKTARLECPGCGVKHEDAARRAMIIRGKWKATAAFRNGIRGYHINGIYCLFAPKRPFKNRLEQMVAGFLKAHSEGRESIKVWTNTFLAETWQEDQERIVAHEIGKRAEEYGPEIPERACMIVSGTDVQRNRLEVGIAAVGPVFEERDGKRIVIGEEIWAMEYRVIAGDPREASVWKEHDDFILNRTWRRTDGIELRLASGCVDSGDGETTDAVYKYCKPRFGQKIFATKGSNQPAQPIVSGMLRAGRYKCPYYRLGTDTAKSVIYGRLKIEAPGAGYIHFPKRQSAGFDDNYFAGLTCEGLVREYHRGRERLVWVKPNGARNEPLDVAVMWLAAIGIVQPQWGALIRGLERTKKDYVLEKPAEQKPKPEQKAAETTPSNLNQDLKSQPRHIRPFKWRTGRGFVNGWRK